MANRRRPHRGQPGPDVLVTGDDGAYAGPQGGARKLKEAFRESGDLESREFGVPEADLPGGKPHVVNAETVHTPSHAPPERPADYHKYHGVPSDNGLYETPDPELTPAARPAPVPKLHDAVPVFVVEGPDSGVFRASSPRSIKLQASTGVPTPVCRKDPGRVRAGLLNEDTASNIRFAQDPGTLYDADGGGGLLPWPTNSYTWLHTQDELWAISADSGTPRLSVIEEYEQKN